MSAISSSEMRSLLRGAAQLGRRWNTTSSAASLAISGMAWMAVAPVPITATRLPARSTGSAGQSKVWKAGPWKLSIPSILG